jgi:hypothetical protein
MVFKSHTSHGILPGCARFPFNVWPLLCLGGLPRIRHLEKVQKVFCLSRYKRFESLTNVQSPHAICKPQGRRYTIAPCHLKFPMLCFDQNYCKNISFHLSARHFTDFISRKYSRVEEDISYRTDYLLLRIIAGTQPVISGGAEWHGIVG